MKKKWIALCVIFVFTMLAVLAAGWKINRRVQVTAYIYDSCGGCFTGENPCKPCTVEMRLRDYLQKTLNAENLTERTEYHVRNLLYEKYQTELNRIREDHKEDLMEEYPLVFVDGQPLAGWDVLRESLVPTIRRKIYGPFSVFFSETAEPEAILLEPDGVNRIVYFKSPGCAQCEQVEDYFRELRESMTGSDTFEIEILDVSQTENIDMMEAYCLEYELEPDLLMTPTVFIGKTVLEGKDEIEIFLEQRLLSGDGEKTPAPFDIG